MVGEIVGSQGLHGQALDWETVGAKAHKVVALIWQGGAIQAGAIWAGKVVLSNGACKVKPYIGMVGLAGSSLGRW